ncbi:MAG: hypothetical protein NWF04_04845 [Candidatus Bathyarchaeota archaeon]|nr:hypothetical protein [Candidatus Bathyarchaeota archaeon]
MAKQKLHTVVVYGRKISSVVLIFNALLTIACAVGILSGFYRAYPFWRPYEPFLVDANLFWLVILGAVVNIFPSACLGKVHTGRLWFHHYVYGFIVSGLAILFVVFFTSVSIFNLFLIDTTNVAVNAGRFFLLGGLALIIDDLPDVCKTSARLLTKLKTAAYKAKKFLHPLQFLLGCIAAYFALAITLHIIYNPQWITLANIILIGTLSVTSLTSLTSAKLKTWLKLNI